MLDLQDLAGRCGTADRKNPASWVRAELSFEAALPDSASVIRADCKTPSATIVSLQMRTELVTTLKRQATELLADLERDKQPILITQHGLPSAYLVDVETYELLQQRMSILEGIARGEMAVAEGRVVPHAEARTRMARWLK